MRRDLLVAALVPAVTCLIVSPAPPGRIVALGDVHGDFQATVQVLQMAQLIDSEQQWIGGDTTLVQLGDLLDRGPEERELWDFFERLQNEAPLVGGRIVRLLGNHEVLNALGRAGSYVHPFGQRQFGDDRCKAFLPGGEYARLLADCPVAAIVGDSVFVHASLPEDASPQSLAKLNKETRRWLLGERKDAPWDLRHGGRESPVWDRTFSEPHDAEVSCEDCDALNMILGRLGVSRLIVGHTPQDSINCACEGAVWRVDTGASRWVMSGAIEALEITQAGEVHVLREGQPLPNSGVDSAGVVVPSGTVSGGAEAAVLTGEDALDSPTCDPD